MTKLKPLSFIRKQLKVRGLSIHSGRGSYTCYSSKLNSVLLQEAKQQLQLWVDKGFVSSVQDNSTTCLSIHLDKNKFDGNYRHIIFRDSPDNWVNARGEVYGKFYCGMLLK